VGQAGEEEITFWCRGFRTCTFLFLPLWLALGEKFAYWWFIPCFVLSDAGHLFCHASISIRSIRLSGISHRANHSIPLFFLFHHVIFLAAIAVLNPMNQITMESDFDLDESFSSNYR
jgi:hypothetical protein